MTIKQTKELMGYLDNAEQSQKKVQIELNVENFRQAIYHLRTVLTPNEIKEVFEEEINK